MRDKDDVLIFIPTLNEADSIAPLIKGFREAGFDRILVIDGGSTDGTREIAAGEGAEVILQQGKGKGMAVRQAFELADSDILVMVDGDGTYLAADAPRLIEPIRSDKADHVIGNRFKGYEKGAFSRLNLVGNQILNRIFGMLYGVWLEDILSGYRAFSRRAYSSFDLREKGFGIEAEITAETIKKDLKIIEVPITYRTRSGRSKLKPVRDGIRIGFTIYKLLRTYKPFFYFGVIGALFLLIGLASGAYVVWEWMKTPRVEHTLLTIFTTLMILTGVQIIIFGVLSDLILLLHKEVMGSIKGGRE